MFRTYKPLWLFWLILLTAPALAAPAPAPQPQTSISTILVVDVQRILDESLAAVSVQKQIETNRSKFQTDIGKEENELRQAEQDLAKSHDKMASDAYAEREQQLRQRFLTVERHVQSRRKVLDQAFSDAMNKVRAGLLDIVTQVAHEHSATMVLTKQQVVWTDKAQDITDEVLGRLNTHLPNVPVKMETAEKTPESAK